MDDPDEMTDLTIERELALLDAGIPVDVIPLRTPNREAALMRQMEQERRQGTAPLRYGGAASQADYGFGNCARIRSRSCRNAASNSATQHSWHRCGSKPAGTARVLHRGQSSTGDFITLVTPQYANSLQYRRLNDACPT
jgi:hypothetical protein